MYARMYDSGQIVIRTHDQHTNGTQDTSGKGRNTGKTKFMIAGRSTRKNEKKLKKVWK